MKLTFFAGRLPHFCDWISPIWHALPPEYRGSFHALGRAAKRATELGIDSIVQKVPRNAELVIVASFEDYRAVSPSPVILVNHGAGQRYLSEKGIDHPSYSGGSNRERVVLFLGPSERDAEVSRLAYPGARSVATGPCRLDPWHRRIPWDEGGRPIGDIRQALRLAATGNFVRRTVAFTFHADVHVCAETRWALPHYKSAITALAHRQAELPFKMIGHCHPRFHNYMAKFWKALKVEFEPDPNIILDTADCLVFDNTSFGFEFASTDRPVVVLDAPWYRPEVEHGLRYWSEADVGIRIQEPSALLPAINLALSDPPHIQNRRREVISRVYDGIPLDGRATERAVSAITRFMNGG